MNTTKIPIELDYHEQSRLRDGYTSVLEKVRDVNAAQKQGARRYLKIEANNTLSISSTKENSIRDVINFTREIGKQVLEVNWKKEYFPRFELYNIAEQLKELKKTYIIKTEDGWFMKLLRRFFPNHQRTENLANFEYAINTITNSSFGRRSGFGR